MTTRPDAAGHLRASLALEPGVVSAYLFVAMMWTRWSWTPRSRNVTTRIASVLLVALAAGACRAAPPPTPRQFELRGQILSVRPDIGEVQIKHEAIAGYMDAMTMSFGVKDRALLQGRAPGDLVRGTLMVTDTDAWLSSLEKTGTASLPAAEPETTAPAPVVNLLEPGQQVPDEGFVDQEGKLWRPAMLAGKAYALTFIYTRCPLPTYCPLMNRNFRAAQQLVASRGALRDQVRFVTISFDPEFDTPALLKRFATAIGADLGTWTFLTGERAAIEAFAGRFGVSVMREPDTPGTITHNLRTAVVGPPGTIAKIYSGNEWTPARLAADLEAVLSR
jgi:protein SCO1/2